jgi:hypothetical protein
MWACKDVKMAISNPYHTDNRDKRDVNKIRKRPEDGGGERGGRGPPVPAPAKGRVGGMRAARQRPTALRRSLLAPRIAHANHAAPKLGLNIRLVM